MSINEVLNKIQTELKAPKSQFNKFGNYNFRNCEDILNALKPFLLELGCVVILDDELVQIGDRYYIKAKATLIHDEHRIETHAFARECQDQEGMNEAQITGSASSYARKYALNALFAIDDTKDADSTNDHNHADIEKMLGEVKDAIEKGDWATLCIAGRHELWLDVHKKLDNHKKGILNKLTPKAAEYRDLLNDYAINKDQDDALQVWEELTENEKKAVWPMVADETHEFIKLIKEAA